MAKMKKAELARVNAMHLALDIARTNGGRAVPSEVIRDAKQIAKFLAGKRV